MERTLDVPERRILGALMEKSLSESSAYPMTVNAIVAACNQKSNRDPIMELDEEVVWATLNRLRERELVAMVLPGQGARTERFKHRAETYFGWQRRQRAVMTELMLRGPQSFGELRTRCSRMVPFDDIEAISTTVESLSALDPPMVAALPRTPGRSAIRYTHLLAPESEQPAVSVDEATAASPIAAPGAVPASGTRITELEGQVTELRDGLADLRQRLETLESQLL